jgi:hypothetical protein
MHGINLVVETDEVVYIGRFDNSNGFQVLMHDCAIHPIAPGEDTEAFVKQTARYGVAVDRRDVVVDALKVRRVRRLGEIDP